MIIKMLLIGLSIFGLVAVSYGQPPQIADSMAANWSDLYRFFDEPVNPELYLIRPGDKLQVTFMDAKLSELELAVGPEGLIIHRSLGIFDLANHTLAQARELLVNTLKRLYSVDEIRISVLEPRRVAVSVSGAVENPGLYQGFTSHRVSEIIELAGGVRYNGSTRNIILTGGPRSLTVDLDRVRYLGDNSANPCLYAGSSIHVPDRAAETIQMVGEVNYPREIEFNAADDLATLVAFAGGARSAANLDSVLVFGQDRRGLALEHGIKAGDIVFVPARIEEAMDQYLTAFGAVGRPGRYPYRADLTVGELIAQAGEVTIDASPSLITIFRRAGADSWGRRSTLRYPITATMGAGSELMAMSLQPADSIYIPFFVGYVRVGGEVLNPGLLPFVPDKDARFYIEAAGGFLPTADTDQLEMYNRIARVTSKISPQVLVLEGYELLVNRREELK
ncbi:MAG: SLBB domain-containing protein [bacterium]